MDEVFDDDLKGVMGDRYIPEAPPVVKYGGGEQSAEGSTEETFDIWGMVKFPLLFLALVSFLAWTAHVELVNEIVAVPGMCLCSACFGWNMKK